MVAGVETLRHRKAHVVRIERIGNDEMRSLRPCDPVRQVVRIGIRIIEEAALLHHEVARVLRAAPEIPAERARTGHLGVDADRFAQMPALFVWRKILVFDPLEAVARDLPARFAHRRDCLG